jgi:hypothetical protein
MTSTFRILLVLAALASSPVLAAEPDAHAAHHPASDSAASAVPAPNNDAAPVKTQGCPMMNGQMMNGQMPMQGSASGQPGMGAMGSGGMTAGANGMNCMNGAHAQPAPGAGHRHHHHHHHR